MDKRLQGVLTSGHTNPFNSEVYFSINIDKGPPTPGGSQTGLQTSPTGENAGPESTIGSGSGETTDFATTSTGWSIKEIGETAAGSSALKPKLLLL